MCWSNVGIWRYKKGVIFSKWEEYLQKCKELEIYNQYDNYRIEFPEGIILLYLLQRLLEQGKVVLGSSEQFVTTLENSPSLLYWVFSISDSYYSD